MDFFGKSVRGSVRRNNEDAFHTPLPGEVPQDLFIVADGMGGTNGGEIASVLAVSTVALHLARHAQREDIPTLLRAAVSEANRLVYTTARQNKAYVEMGTTLSAVVAAGNQLTIANVGDSRVYHLGECFTQITVDHSYVQELLKSGLISGEEAERHPDRNRITRALGPEKFIQADIFQLNWRQNDWLLLCTDGLYTMVGAAQMEQLLKNAASCEQAAEALVMAAEEAGGKDNITVVCLRNT